MTWEKFGWPGATTILALSLLMAGYFAQRGSSSAAAWKDASEGYKSQVQTLKEQLADANDKRDDNADKLLSTNRYLGSLEAQNATLTEQQKATAAALRTIIGKGDDIQKSRRLAAAGKTSKE